MRIGLDVRYLSHGLVGGVHTYLKHLVPALIEAGRTHHFVLYADTKAPFELQHLPDHVTVRYLPYRGPHSSLVNDLVKLRRAMAQDALDVAHFPTNYGFAPAGVASVITLHDAINVMPLREIIAGHAKNPRTIAMMTYLHLMSSQAVRGAHGILTVSEHARRAILHYTRLAPAQVVAIHHAPTPDLRRISDQAVLAEMQARHGITRPYLLADGLKNPAVLVRAWRLLPAVLRERYEIVFFARQQPLPVVQEAVEAGFARLLLRPSREDLIALFSGASAFLFPSWIEGFGIPLLEAMTCGAPVIASDRGSIPEVAGDAALIADAEDERGFAHHIEAVLTDPAEADRLRERGYERMQAFSWAKTAEQTLASYQRFVAATGQHRPGAAADLAVPHHD
ncbi:glycosyltransferase family 4 protein [Candidatus Chloroploca asiatica]|uniref:Glycosyl transferase family 1 n=1 Tax=Candidatus Chloroploca asiatica TaxID=1506545 RepID=A0A2H3KFJ3_9CHLR|nr:glycosyltransferase family 1 protein [Candidatus Chloroploca asiatica]PDV96454.1 glycosyl transferase family 1 [Candidatus Chloroploca asiatica]